MIEAWKGLSVLSLVLAIGCAGPALPQSAAPGPQASAAPKRITAAIRGDIPSLAPGAAGPVPGRQEMYDLVNVGFASFDTRASLVPRLAEAVPTTENGLWVVYPDGRMETTWKIRAGAQWHDGRPFTSEDVLFTARLDQDPALPSSREPAYRSIDNVEAPDPRTVTVKWKRPYIEADAMWFRFPNPSHLLLEAYIAGDAERFLGLPYWSEEFVGTGPYKVREWARGSHVVLQANDRYVLGRPKIDVIEGRFIPDPNTIAANILADSVDVTFGGRLALDWALQVREQWGAGGFEVAVENPVVLYPNLLNPQPPALINVQLRRALLHAVDRQQLMDALVHGMSAVTDVSVLRPDQTEYLDVEASIVRYPYDPRTAMRLVEGLGYQTGPDGTFRDGGGQRLSVEIRTTSGDVVQEHSMFAVASDWQRIGIAVEPVVVPAARRADREYRNTFPAFDLRRQPHRLDTLAEYFYGGNSPLPENNYTGNSYTRYRNPEWDALIDRFTTTVPRAERMQVLRQIVHHMTDQVLVLGLFYDVDITMVAKRLKNVSRASRSGGEAWNVHEWELA